MLNISELLIFFSGRVVGSLSLLKGARPLCDSTSKHDSVVTNQIKCFFLIVLLSILKFHLLLPFYKLKNNT